MAIEGGADNPTNNPFVVLEKKFSPGTKGVVCFRSGERIIKGDVVRIEGKNAFVRYTYLGQTQEVKVNLYALGRMNPGLSNEQLPTEKKK